MIFIEKTLKILALTVSISLIGCGTSFKSYQQQCEANNTSFPAMVACLKKSVLKDQNIADADLAKLYVAYADALSHRVKQKHISEADARFMLAKMNYDLTTESTRRKEEYNQKLSKAFASAADHINTTQQQQMAQSYAMKPITCHKQGNFINCW